MKKSKKFLSALLCVMLLVTMMPAMAFADTTGEPAAAVPSQTATKDGVTLSKSLTQDQDGTYTVTLEAKALGETVIETKAVPTDFVVVLDQSGSMDEDIKIGKIANLDSLDTELGAKAGFYKCTLLLELFDHPMRYYNGEWQYRFGLTDLTWVDVNDSWLLSDVDNIYVSRINAAKVAMKKFIKAVADDKATSGNDHRIAVVGFSDDVAVLSDLTAADESAGVINKFKALYDNATGTDKGMNKAKEIFAAEKAADADAYAKRGHVVIVLSDGEPTTSNTFSEKVADGALAAGKDLKGDLNAKIYTIGLDLKSGENSNVVKFMNYLSSNYPNAESMKNPGAKAEGADYYSLVTSSKALNNVFEKIAVEGIKTDVTLDEYAVLTDKINGAVFDVGTGLTASRVSVNPTTATVDTDALADGIVKVSGYSYKDNAVADGKGQPLTVTISGLKLKDDALFDTQDPVASNDGTATVAAADGTEAVAVASPTIATVPVMINYHYSDKTDVDTETKYAVAGSKITQDYVNDNFAEEKAGYDLEKVEPFTGDATTAVVGPNGLEINIYYSLKQQIVEVNVFYTQPGGVTGEPVKDVVVLDGTGYNLLNPVGNNKFNGWETPQGKEFKGWKLVPVTDNSVLLQAGSQYELNANTSETTFVAVYGEKEPQGDTVTITYKQPSSMSGVAGADVTATVEKGKYVGILTWDAVSTKADESGDAWTKTGRYFLWWVDDYGKRYVGLNDENGNPLGNYTFNEDITLTAQYLSVNVTYCQRVDTGYTGTSVGVYDCTVTEKDGKAYITLSTHQQVTQLAAKGKEMGLSYELWTNPSKMRFDGWQEIKQQIPRPIAINNVTVDETSNSTGVYAGGAEYMLDAEALKDYMINPYAHDTNLSLQFLATYKKKSSATMFTLDFETNGGTEIASITRASGAVVDLDEFIPTKKGYNFKGWYLDKDLKDKVTSVTMLSNMTVYAKWGAKSTGSNGTPSDLNSKDHIKYVVGYPDGYVRPNNFVTRAETASMLYRLLTDERRAEVRTFTNRFSDVDRTTWYVEPASSMYKGGYIAGYADGTFGGDRNITRAEFVSMLVRFIGTDKGTMNFSDVSVDHWAYKNIAIATSQGWISGYSDGTFKPDQAITRAEAMSIINRVLNRGVNASSKIDGFKIWPDNYSNAWYYYDVIEATNGHDYTGERPSENWIRVK